MVADVSTYAGAREAVAACHDAWGRPPDGLAALAGASVPAALHRTPEALYQTCLRDNLDSAFFSLQAWIDAALQARQPGNAVLVSSVVARIGVANQEAISAAKAAVEGLVRGAAASYAARGLRVNAVAHGLTRTPETQRMLSRPAALRQVCAQYRSARGGWGCSRGRNLVAVGRGRLGDRSGDPRRRWL